MISKPHLALAAVLCALSAPAMASSQASASITNLRFELIDLNPYDSFSAYVNYGGGNTTLSLVASDGGVGESDSMTRTRSGFQAFSRFYDSDLEHVSARASIDLNSLSASGSAQGAATSYSVTASTYASQLVLSPHTMLVVTADAAASASALGAPSCGSGYYWYGCGPSETASANASMQLNYAYYTGGTSVSVNQSESISLTAQSRGEFHGYDYVYDHWNGYYQYQEIHSPQTEESKSDQRMLTGVFVNMTGSEQSAYLSLGTTVSGSASVGAPMAMAAVTAVPEADTTVLALAGMALTAAVVRRRRQA